MFVVSQKVETCDVNYFLAWNELNYMIIIIITMRKLMDMVWKLLEVGDELLFLLLDCPPNTLFDRGERKWRQKNIYAVQENFKKRNKKMQKSLNKCRGAA